MCNHRQLCLKKAVIDDNNLLEWYVVILAMLLTPGVKHLFLFRHILEARSELKFHGIYRLGNRFSKFVWHDYLILIPDLLKGLCAEVSMECETTLRYALQLRLLGDMHSDMIGLKNLWSPNYFYGHR